MNMLHTSVRLLRNHLHLRQDSGAQAGRTEANSFYK